MANISGSVAQVSTAVQYSKDFIQKCYNIDPGYYNNYKVPPSVKPVRPRQKDVDINIAINIGQKISGGFKSNTKNMDIVKKADLQSEDLELQKSKDRKILLIEEVNRKNMPVYTVVLIIRSKEQNITQNERICYIMGDQNNAIEVESFIDKKNIHFLKQCELNGPQSIEVSVFLENAFASVDKTSKELMCLKPLENVVREYSIALTRLERCITEVNKISVSQPFTFKHANLLIICLETLSLYDLEDVCGIFKSKQSDSKHSKITIFEIAEGLQKLRNNILLHGQDRVSWSNHQFCFLTPEWLAKYLNIENVETFVNSLKSFMTEYSAKFQKAMNILNFQKLPEFMSPEGGLDFSGTISMQTHASEFFKRLAKLGFCSLEVISLDEDYLDELAFNFTVNIIPFLEGMFSDIKLGSLPQSIKQIRNDLIHGFLDYSDMKFRNLYLIKAIRNSPSILYKFCICLTITKVICESIDTYMPNVLKEKLQAAFTKASEDIVGDSYSNILSENRKNTSPGDIVMADNANIKQYIMNYLQIFSVLENKAKIGPINDWLEGIHRLSSTDIREIFYIFLDLKKNYKNDIDNDTIFEYAVDTLSTFVIRCGIKEKDIRIVVDSFVANKDTIKFIGTEDAFSADKKAVILNELVSCYREYEAKNKNPSCWKELREYCSKKPFTHPKFFVVIQRDNTEYRYSMQSSLVVYDFLELAQDFPQIKNPLCCRNMESEFLDEEFIAILTNFEIPFKFNTRQDKTASKRLIRVMSELEFMSPYLSGLLKICYSSKGNEYVSEQFLKCFSADLRSQVLTSLLLNNERSKFIPRLTISKTSRFEFGFEAEHQIKSYYDELWAKIIRHSIKPEKFLHLLVPPNPSWEFLEAIIEVFRNDGFIEQDKTMAIEILKCIVTYAVKKFFFSLDEKNLNLMLSGKNSPFQQIGNVLMDKKEIQENDDIFIEAERLLIQIKVKVACERKNILDKDKKIQLGNAFSSFQKLAEKLKYIKPTSPIYLAIMSNISSCGRKRWPDNPKWELEHLNNLLGVMINACMEVNYPDCSPKEQIEGVLHSSMYKSYVNTLDAYNLKCVNIVHIFSQLGQSYLQGGMKNNDDSKLQDFLNALDKFELVREFKDNLPNSSTKYIGDIAYTCKLIADFYTERNNSMKALEYRLISLERNAESFKENERLICNRHQLICKLIQDIKVNALDTLKNLKDVLFNTTLSYDEQLKLIKIALEISGLHILIRKDAVALDLNLYFQGLKAVCLEGVRFEISMCRKLLECLSPQSEQHAKQQSKMYELNILKDTYQ